MKIKLSKVQKTDGQAQKIRGKIAKSWKNINAVLYYQSILYMLKNIRIQLGNKHHNNILAKNFKIHYPKIVLANSL